MMGFSKKLVGATLTAALVFLALASTATASSHNPPTAEFKPFGECPLNNAEIDGCIYLVSNGGSYTIGAKTVHLVNPITLQGGFVEEEVEPFELHFHGAENGDTLSKTPEPVPGGLQGVTAPTSWPQFLQDWFNELIEEGFTGVTATIELAEPATAITLSLEHWLLEEGTALGLPVKIKLDNAALGNNCYIGSNEEPIQLELTSGTSGALSGAPGTITFNGAFTLVTISGFNLVDGTFAAPAASGCGGIFSEFVDPLVNSIFGLPAGSEENSFSLEGVLKDAVAEVVLAP
jgi:hypothetical protein